MTAPLELLAPAKTAEIGIAAIDHGADAVYIGAPQFGARADASNTYADIERLIQYAHLYYCRVYVTMNTIINDAELIQAQKAVQTLYSIGTDGLIIQDMGLLELDLPKIPLIASTQMHNIDSSHIQFLEDIGFTRVILARELSLPEISAIRQKTNIELEAFVHGALCVAYSGRCYMSQAITGRSGNRGVCAQPCRSRYTLRDGNKKVIADRKFLLSLKDLNLSEHIAELIAAGISSFKIEGRLKGIDYVKNVVAYYRKTIDDYIDSHPGYCRASSGQTQVDFQPDLSRTFNRGYTDYFLHGRNNSMASIHTRKSIGQSIGNIVSIHKDCFEFKGLALKNGDGLCFFNDSQELQGFRVEQAKKRQVYPNSMNGLRAGSKLFRNRDQEFIQTLNKNTSQRQIPLKIEFKQDVDSIRIQANDEDGVLSQVNEAVAFVQAKQPEQMKAKIIEHLSRSGDTPYMIKNIDIAPSQPGFIPLSQLNEFRRRLLELHTRKRLEIYLKPGSYTRPDAKAVYPKKDLTYEFNVLNEQARAFYRRHGVNSIDPAFEDSSKIAGKTVMTTKYCIRYQLDACLRNPGSRQKLKAPLRIDDGRHHYLLRFDCDKCQMEVALESLKPSS